MPKNTTNADVRDATLDLTGPAANATAPTIHFTLQGKGGVGKSLVASILAQYFLHRGANIRCLDTDPVNRTFSQYEAFCAEHLQLMSDGKVDYGSKNDVESKPVEWWARQDSNLRPPACEAGALTN